ncbi:uncharacterized protein [Oryza sativa Japonica Group]|uniref:Os07g0665900 protein n=3 Tax=Oryza TaxID=4527 RepID=Q0D3U1_ORYSJ|nr:uncharacterized protein LOC4344214 [Oryza sativa Japonica Group]XP_015644879.1 uncharacterized protein LOC4344214 [Oryza sativa Japonica Group]XP_025883023.1 uncharacterized protein LOC4344214 [Oryza sativa Japonica Group]KAB8106759.1 hypothetical protein EE612_041240 [Oryza sativa]KAF2924370.1 hypothetical protein DAI22_07g264700 [Oryza sativa Japonica Group]KAF2924371.1 hypothetical protein DAI22_07g264700 [Oryza sativa Japonica Group]BAF22482.1 Os07g0665900 [Oryza sativa Japonica Group]|eukprot:NP_001060568.1 Os07g0665900 [Oryza sativa Japonica Group]
MPSITCDKVVLDNLYGEIAKSVVTIKRYNRTGLVNFATGFIIYATRSEVLVCTDHTVLKQGEDTYVYYSDGTARQAFEFIKRTPCGHAILLVSVQPGERRQYPVSFSTVQAKREEICMIARVNHDGDPGFMSGIVVAPSGKIMLRSGRVITSHEKKFALTCPHGRRGNVVAEGNLIGAAVFTLSGLVVGTIDSVVSGCFGLKFARHSSFFLDELNRMVHKELKKVSLSRGATPLSRGSKVVHVGSTSKRSHEGQTNVAAEKRAKYAAIRHRMEDWCGGSSW